MLLLVSGQEARAEAPSDSLKTNTTTVKAFPYVYYTPETELAFGAGGILTFYTGKNRILRPSKLTVNGFYSSNDQYEVSLSPVAYFRLNKTYVGANISFGHFVRKYFGVGSHSPELGNESYINDRFAVELNVETPPLFFVSDRSGLIYDYEDLDIVDPQDNPYLGDENLVGRDGGVLSGVGGTWVWDNRDHSFFPNDGALHRIKTVFYSRTFGSEFTYSSFEIDSRRYFGLGPDRVLAIRMFVHTTGGNTPFYKLPGLGGQHAMRGYYEGRYRDDSLFMAQIEYRQFVSRRLGFVAFASGGEVASAVPVMRIDETIFAGGFGLRFLFNEKEKVNLRMDLGFGRDAEAVYFGIEEAF